MEDDISDTNINLTPLLKSIEELKRAATEINNQRRVSIEFPITRDQTLSFLMITELNHDSPGNRTKQRLAVDMEETSFEGERVE